MQTAIHDAGAIPPLLRLLASANRHVQPVLACLGWSCPQLTPYGDQEKGQRPRRTTSLACAVQRTNSIPTASSSCGAAPGYVLLSYVLRTLVNLTSNAREGGRVRQVSGRSLGVRKRDCPNGWVGNEPRTLLSVQRGKRITANKPLR